MPLGQIDWTAAFEGWEYVMVPAGQRLTARINYTEARRVVIRGQTFPLDVRGTWWFDPEIDWWVRRQQTQNGQTQTLEAWVIKPPR